jgi:hypothetical protein
MEPPRGKDLSPDYEDDPEAEIFWGPKQPNGMMTRWSRPWFDWRRRQVPETDHCTPFIKPY